MMCSCSGENCCIVKIDSQSLDPNSIIKRILTKQIEDDDSLTVLIELPGIDKSSLKVSAKTDKLAIKAKRSESLQKFYSSNDVSYSIQLKNSVDPTTSVAKLADGVLTVIFKLQTPKANINIE